MDGSNEQHPWRRLGWRLNLILVMLLLTGEVAVGQYLQQQVESQWTSVTSKWQSDQVTGALWSEYLGEADLRAELGRGSSASAEKIGQIVDRLGGLETRVDDEELSSAKTAIAAWLENPADRGASTAVQRSLRSLQTWIRRNRSRAAGWDRFLELDRLNVELRKGDQVDREWVQSVLKRFEAASKFDQGDDFAKLQRVLRHWQHELERELSDPLAIRVRQAKQPFVPLAYDRYNHALQELRDELNRLDQFLRSGGAEKERGWKTYLLWDDLQAEVMETDRPRLAVIEKTLARLGGDTSGPDRHPFVRSQRALRRFLSTLTVAESDTARLHDQRDRVRREVEQLERFLARGGAKKEGDWKEYLKWDEWHDGLFAEEPEPRKLAALAGRLRADEPALRKLPFRQLERAVSKYVELQRLQEQSSPSDDYLRRLEELARAIDQRNQPDPAIQAEIRRQLEWLRESGQSLSLVSHIEATRRQPNVRLQVAEDLLVRQVSNVVNQRSPVGRWFEGAWVQGTADTNAQITGELIPSANQVTLDIVLHGKTFTNSVATQRRVNVYTYGNTHTEGRKRIYVDEGGLRAEPARAVSATRQQINSVQVNRRVGRRVITRAATRRAYEKKPRAERVANGDASSAIQESMDEQAEELIRKANQTIEARIAAPLRNNYLYPEQLLMWSTDSHVLMQGLLAPGDALGTEGPMPPLPSGSGVAIVAHQTAANNVLAEYLGDVTINSDQMQAVMERYNLPQDKPASADSANSDAKESVSGDAAEATDADSAEGEDEPWSITFDHLQPATVQFDKQRVTIAVVGVRFTRGADEIVERIRMRATYEVVMAGADVELVRDGDVEIDFLDITGQLSSEELAYKTFLRNRIEPLFRERMSTRDLPDNEASARLKAFALKSLAMDAGWISLGLDVDTSKLKGLGLQ